MVQCSLSLDDAKNNISMQLSTQDLAYADRGTPRLRQPRLRTGPFSEGWYSSHDLATPLLCERADCLYIFFNVATLDLSTDRCMHGRAPWPARTRALERIVGAMVKAADEGADACDTPALLLMIALDQLLQFAGSLRLRLVRDAVEAIVFVGTRVLHAVSTECKSAAMSRVAAAQGQVEAGVGGEGGRGRHTEMTGHGRTGMQTSMGLFVLQAAVSALQRVCLAKCEAALAALRSDANLIDLLVAVLSLSERGCGFLLPMIKQMSVCLPFEFSGRQHALTARAISL